MVVIKRNRWIKQDTGNQKRSATKTVTRDDTNVQLFALLPSDASPGFPHFHEEAILPSPTIASVPTAAEIDRSIN